MAELEPCHIPLERQQTHIIVEPRPQEIIVSACKEGPVQQTLVLVPEARSPAAVIGIEIPVIEGKGAAVELHRPGSAALTGHHEALQQPSPGEVFGLWVS